MYRLRRQNGGFTLIEALIVIMYIAIIACIVLPNLTGAGRRARETALRATLNEMRKAAQSYQAETGLFPFDLTDLAATEAPDVGLTPSGAVAAVDPADWKGPYLMAGGGGLPKDPTNGGHEWGYQVETGGQYDLGWVYSLSAGNSLDGQPYSMY